MLFPRVLDRIDLNMRLQSLADQRTLEQVASC